MTFYYHFKDIYDLLEWGIINEGQKILAGNKTAKTWQQGMKNIFETALENKAFVTNAYHSLGRERTEKYLDEPVFDLTYGVVNEESKGMSVSEENRRDVSGQAGAGSVLGEWFGLGQVRGSDRDVALDRVGDEHSVPIQRVALAVCPDDELRDGPHRLDRLSFTPGVDKKDGLPGEVRDRRPLVVRDRVRHVPEDRGPWLLILGVAVDVLSSRRALWTC
jgi:hypothetical protein